MMIEHLTTGLTGFGPDEFPDARDFTVELTVRSQDRGTGSLTLAYAVSSPAIRIRWSWWSEPLDKVRTWTVADVPRGTVEKPYCDVDQGWNIMIWQSDDQVFVAEGDGEWDEEREQSTYTRWFKVSRKLYDAGWAAALDRCRTA